MVLACLLYTSKSAKLEITLGVLGLLACIVSYILGNEWSIKFTGLFYISVIVFVELYFLVRYELAEPEKIVECILYICLLYTSSLKRITFPERISTGKTGTCRKRFCI